MEIIYESPQADGALGLTVQCRDGHKPYELTVLLSPAQQKDRALVETMRERLRQEYRDHRGQMH